MPIEHLAHRPRLPLAGKIRLGIRVKNAQGVEHPLDLPYFVMPGELIQRDPEHFKEPKSLDIMFHSDNEADVFDPFYERYAGRAGGGGGLITLRCDGKTYTEIPTNINERTSQGRCQRALPEDGEPWPTCPCGAMPKGRLRMLLIKGPVGIFQLTMGGHQQIQQFQADMRMRRAEFGGRLAKIPFRLVRRPETSQVPDKHGNRIPKLGHPVRLESFFTLHEAMTSRGVNPYELAAAVQKSLPGPIPDEPDVDEDYDEEADPQLHAATNASYAVQTKEPVRGQVFAETVREMPDDWQAEQTEDDESMAFALADALGVSQTDYEVYTKAKYRGGKEGQLEPEHVRAECEMFRNAVTDEAKADLLRRITVKANALRAAAVVKK